MSGRTDAVDTYAAMRQTAAPLESAHGFLARRPHTCGGLPASTARREIILTCDDRAADAMTWHAICFERFLLTFFWRK